MRLPDLTAADVAALRPGRRALWVAKYAAVGGGGFGVAGGLGYGVLKGEARLARRRIRPPELPPLADGWYGPRGLGRKPLHLAVLGDSVGAGMGADAAQDTVGALLATALVEATGRPVRLRVVAESGAVSADLPAQVDVLLAERAPEVAVVSIGGNDVTHLVAPDVAAVPLRHAVTALVGAGARVVVGTCPDLGTVRPLAPPLRQYARWKSRRMAAEQERTVREAGAVPVPLGELLGPRFATTSELFSVDRFHPSSAGYRLVAAAVLPFVREAVGLPALEGDEMVQVADAVDAASTLGTPLTERDEADRLVRRFWDGILARVPGRRGGDRDADRDEVERQAEAEAEAGPGAGAGTDAEAGDDAGAGTRAAAASTPGEPVALNTTDPS